MTRRKYNHFTLLLAILLLLVGSVARAEVGSPEPGKDQRPFPDLTGTWSISFAPPALPFAESMLIDSDGLVCLDDVACGSVAGRSVWINRTFRGTFSVRLLMVGVADQAGTRIVGSWTAFNPLGSVVPLTSFLVGSWQAYKQE